LRITSPWFYVDVAGFYTYLDNAIVRADFTFNGRDSIMYDGELSRVQALVNADYARVWGTEVEVGIKLARKLVWRNYFTYMRGFDSQGNSLRHVPPMFGSSHLMFSTTYSKADLFLRFNGEIPYDCLAPSEQHKPHLYAIDKDGNPYYPAWWTLNLSYKRSWKRLVLYATLENILDKRYRLYSSGIAAPGRSLNFGFVYQF
jgi:hemoglobin/transferrin/lactoferrin receptor protein